MNRIHATIAALLLLASGLRANDTVIPAPEPPPVGVLRFHVDNVKEAVGTIWVGIYSSEKDFLDREKARLVPVKVTTTGRTYIEIPGLLVGEEYALGIFHDENDNGEFDTNWLGLPAEPWAFSGTLKSRFRLPDFEEVKFVFRPEKKQQELRLRVWF